MFLGYLLSGKPSSSCTEHNDRQGRCGGRAVDKHFPFLGALGSISQHNSPSFYLLLFQDDSRASGSVGLSKFPPPRFLPLLQKEVGSWRKLSQRKKNLSICPVGTRPCILTQTRWICFPGTANVASHLGRPSALKPRGGDMVDFRTRSNSCSVDAISRFHLPALSWSWPPIWLLSATHLMSISATNCAPPVPLRAEQPEHVGQTVWPLISFCSSDLTPTTSGSAALQDQAQMALGSIFFGLNPM